MPDNVKALFVATFGAVPSDVVVEENSVTVYTFVLSGRRYRLTPGFFKAVDGRAMGTFGIIYGIWAV